jgi:hypothetical protein
MKMLGVCLIDLFMPSLIWLQNEHNKLPLAMQASMLQQSQDVYSQTIAYVSLPSNTNQHVCYNLHLI